MSVSGSPAGLLLYFVDAFSAVLIKLRVLHIGMFA